jgi:hypothetical protein
MVPEKETAAGRRRGGDLKGGLAGGRRHCFSSSGRMSRTQVRVPTSFSLAEAHGNVSYGHCVYVYLEFQSFILDLMGSMRAGLVKK